jgi:hypothetical protein
MNGIRRGVAALLIIMSFAAPGLGDNDLRPGLHAAWSIDLLSEGRHSTDRVALDVREEREPGLWILELTHGKDRWRLHYTSGGDLPHFSPERVVDLEAYEDGRWQGRGSSELGALNNLVLMELRLAGAEHLGDTVQAVSGHELRCSRYALRDQGESLQEGPTVTLRTLWEVKGEVWVSSEIPLAGWVRYREERSTRKRSEIGEQVFEGAEEVGVTEWILEEWRSP